MLYTIVKMCKCNIKTAAIKRPLIICGPSGSGKSTILSKLMADFPNKFGFSISHTTRKPRPGEIDGKHYHFTDIDRMEKAISEGKFIETAKFSGNMYGTSIEAVQEVQRRGKICILDIDVQGVKQVKKTDLNPWCIFIKPPSIKILKERLLERKTETPESLQMRLEVAIEEIHYGTSPGNFHLVVVNDDIDKAYIEIKEFIVNNVLK